jgi:hypothetical protein
MSHSFGLYNDNFKMASVTHQTRETITVRRQLKDVTVKCGPLQLGETIHEKTFMVVVNYRKARKKAK